MTCKPCVLVPCYNHARQFENVLAQLAVFALPCIVVDDGSDAENAALLQQLCQRHTFVTLERLERNSGKGAAVQHGIGCAAQRQYTHVLQIDADGQHDLQMIPELLAASAASPDAVICGWPQYGDDVPKARLYGRRITQFWVHIETLSTSIKDAMCGFRVYPLPPLLELVRRRLSQRMDFDIEILVRLSWKGVPLQFIKTDVRYPADGVSHFAMVRDNLKISALHTRLVCGMLLRLPLLLWRRGRPPRHWSEQDERGVYWAMWICLQCYKFLGERSLRLLLVFVVAYFYAANSRARAASKKFLTLAHARGAALATPPTAAMVYQHLYSFGLSVLERIASWAGKIKREQVIFPGRTLLHEQKKSGRGALILASHLGNLEMCRALVDQVSDLKMNVLVFTQHAAQINKLMREVNPRAGVELIQVDQIGPGTAMLLLEKLERGEFIVIAADRTSPTAPHRTAIADFLGVAAEFPQGPYILAALLRCPVYLLFCLKQRGQYHLYLENFAAELVLPRKTRDVALQAWAQKFAARLEFYALQAPLQWFNFYDFWESHPLRRRQSTVRNAKAETSDE